METLHPEGDSPFVVKDDASIAAVLALEYDESPEEAAYTSCPVEGCGEQLLWEEMDSHLELHTAEQDSSDDRGHDSKRLKLEPGIDASFDTKLSHALRNIGDDDDDVSGTPSPERERQAAAKDIWKALLKMPETSSKKVIASTSATVKRKLGVSTWHFQSPSRVANPPSEVGTRPPRAREADAIMACQTSRDRWPNHHRE